MKPPSQRDGTVWLRECFPVFFFLFFTAPPGASENVSNTAALCWIEASRVLQWNEALAQVSINFKTPKMKLRENSETRSSSQALKKWSVPANRTQPDPKWGVITLDQAAWRQSARPELIVSWLHLHKDVFRQPATHLFFQNSGLFTQAVTYLISTNVSQVLWMHSGWRCCLLEFLMLFYFFFPEVKIENHWRSAAEALTFTNKKRTQLQPE